MASQSTTHSHRYQHFENLQMSADEFYKLLEKNVIDYKYPGVECKRVTLKENGIFSSSREYLAISRKLYTYYVCAAPFGKSFFISWWFMENANKAANLTAKIPVIGKPIANRIESKSYYELDTELMFTESINAIVKTTVNKVAAEQGYRRETQPATEQ
jgi:hypothetical protein